MRPAILIHGPTASGKSALAMRLAKEVSGEIVNADAMQVYADLRILTARPSDADMNEVVHHLYGHMDAAVPCSVEMWRQEAMERIDAVRSRGACPIVVGGTGLNFAALAGRISAIPEITPQIRARARARVEASHEAARAELARLDPVTARRIALGDGQRLARALEVHDATGQPLSNFHARSGPVMSGPWLGVTLMPPRQWVYARIEARFAAMIASTAVEEEVRRLRARGLAYDAPVHKSHGVKWILSWLDGHIGKEEMRDKACVDIRHYAKRQYSWAANQLARWPRIPALRTANRSAIITALLSEIDGNTDTR